VTISVRRTYSGKWETTHRFTRPAVYFDHWAVRAFSDDPIRRPRLLAALQATGGSLCLSHLAIAEFSAGGDPIHADSAEAFFDAALPSVYFMEIDVRKASAAEEHFGIGNTRPPPDQEMLALLTNRIDAMGGNLSMRGLVRAVAESSGDVGRSFAEVNREIAGMVAREKANPEFTRKAKQFQPQPDRPPTLTMMGELLRTSILDSGATFTEHDAADYQHAIISSVYCDYVLLDGKW